MNLNKFQEEQIKKGKESVIKNFEGMKVSPEVIEAGLQIYLDGTMSGLEYCKRILKGETK